VFLFLMSKCSGMLRSLVAKTLVEVLKDCQILFLRLKQSKETESEDWGSSSCETSVPVYLKIQHHIQEDLNLQQDR
jgi:hypothetical protein